MISKFMNIRPAHNITFKFMNGNVQWFCFSFQLWFQNFDKLFEKNSGKLVKFTLEKKFTNFQSNLWLSGKNSPKKRNSAEELLNLGSVYVFGKISCASNKNKALCDRYKGFFGGKKWQFVATL